MHNEPRPAGQLGATPPLIGILHVHSNFSHDGRDRIADLRAASLARGIAFVGLTDHAEDLGSERFDRLRRECDDHSDASVRLIPGAEFRFPGYPGLHLLAIGLHRWIEAASPAELAAAAAEHAELVAVAHPRLFDYELPPAVAARVHAIEVWNAAHDTRYLPDPRAVTLLRHVRRTNPHVVGFAGLDQHDARNDRRARVVVDPGERNPLSAIREGRFTNRGCTMQFSPGLGWGPVRLGLLYGARAVYDVMERVQERAARALARSRQPAAPAASPSTQPAAAAGSLERYRRRLAEAEEREAAMHERH